MDMREYVAAFDQVRIDFERDVAEFGLPFEQGESSPRKLRDEVAARTGCHCENCSASLWRKWISPACVACRTGERTETFFVSLACNRDCYFCFNPNQVDYEYHRTHRRDIASELESQHAAGAHFDFLAVTGGEPLLFKDEVLAFLEKARELYPHAHTRLYTNGDLLDEVTARQLAKAGLHEIRFSVKPEDVSQAVGDQSAGSQSKDPGSQTRGLRSTLGTIAMAVDIIPDVMVEMPVIPGSLAQMKGLLLRLDELGVRGINLLEFCFPLANAGAFREHGFELRKNPMPSSTTTGTPAACPSQAARASASPCSSWPRSATSRSACTTARWTTRTRGRYTSRTRASCSILRSGRHAPGWTWTGRTTSSSAPRHSAPTRRPSPTSCEIVPPTP